MRYTIKSKILNKEFNFWIRELNNDYDGGYIFLESENHEATLGSQITKNGGATIYATRLTFKSECKSWYRNHLKHCKEWGE